MSRVGLASIELPPNVKLQIDGALLSFSSSLGSRSYIIPLSDIIVENRDGFLYVLPVVDIARVKDIIGLHRALIKNIVDGLSIGFKKELCVVGVGYKAIIVNKYLFISIGYSHDICYMIPKNISIEVVKDTIIIKSIDRMLIGAVARDICSFRKFDPYKGKGIYIKGDFLLRKQAKKK